MTWCSAPFESRTVQLAHGGGGRAMKRLIDRMFLPAFAAAGDVPHDSAVCVLGSERIAFTTDSFVVSPLFFPGGDIGTLAVVGTVNDLAMAGAVPRVLSAAFILEEGFLLDDLGRVVESMRRSAEECGVRIVTGDTKVVPRGKGDGVFITTAGIGTVAEGVLVHPGRVVAGDVVLVSGDLGRHGIAVLSVRDGIAFDSPVSSDCAPLHRLTGALCAGGLDVHFMRDATRGGLASVLNECAEGARVDVVVEESGIPVSDGVACACELLGFDPLYVACEGRMVVVVSAAEANEALGRMRSLPEGRGAVCIGEVREARGRGQVALRTRYGTERRLDLLSGEQLPRIC